MKASVARAFSALLLLASASAQQAPANFINDCSSFASTFENENTEVLNATYVPKGTSIPDTSGCGTDTATTTANICRITLKITTSSTSRVITEVWLPQNWKNKGKRVVMIGGAAWGGCIEYLDMAWTSGLGFAAIGHDTGHEGNTATGFVDPEVWKDWVYRSLLVASQAGKAATTHFFETPLSKSYFIGCSTGGRQGLKLAQDYPDEFDGIIAASPTAYWPNIEVSEAIYALIVGTEGSSTFLTRAQWDAVDAATMAQCDSIDGVSDGVLENPLRCDFHPEALLCGPGQTWAANDCLTATQIQTVKKLYSPLYGNRGRYILPRLIPGGDTLQGYFAKYGPFAGFGAQDFLRYVVFNDPTYDLRSQFTLDTADLMMDNDWFGAHSNKSDLTELQASGHKLLVYHGLADPLVQPEISYNYYHNVALNMSLPSSGLDSFFRFFPISGLAHCAGGRGTSYVGGPGQIRYTTGTPDNTPVANTALMALVRWVEEGTGPETLRGYRLDTLGEILGQKDHCKYPLRTTYKGRGNPNNRANWECK